MRTSSYARDFAGVDVSALTDHDHSGQHALYRDTGAWHAIRSATARFHEPGRFVALLGYEWTSWLHGHRHVLYFHDERGAPHDGETARVFPWSARATSTPTGLWDALRGTGALTIPHHPAGGPIPIDWRFYAPREHGARGGDRLGGGQQRGARRAACRRGRAPRPLCPRRARARPSLRFRRQRRSPRRASGRRLRRPALGWSRRSLRHRAHARRCPRGLARPAYLRDERPAHPSLGHARRRRDGSGHPGRRAREPGARIPSSSFASRPRSRCARSR